MTDKEKAKAYYEAFKRAEDIHRFSSDPAEIKRMEEIFPELKETSEMKKALAAICLSQRAESSPVTRRCIWRNMRKRLKGK